ncbi:E3 ubiquitin-protein ligase TRIM71-like [Argopecten irradians]|uniref:E3 ubiquitin-protein ligase TRIM71-like n=1 Tax=Argopecten irradians TaxID=31199 RepID=UPI0037117DC5
MAAAKMPFRLKGQDTCGYHKEKQLDIYCEKCNEPVCPKCVTSLHKGHLFCDLSEITPQKKEKIRNFIDKTEQIALPDIGNYIASANTLLTENDSIFEKLSKDLKAQTERLKQDLDKLTTETLSLYQKIKEDNTKLIQKYKQNLEMCDKRLKEQLQECKNVFQHGSHIDIYDTEYELDSKLHLPVKPVLGTASFTPNKTPRKQLELAIGTSKSDDSGQTSTLKDKGRSVSVSNSQGQSSTHLKTSGKRTKAVTRTKLLTNIMVIEEWKSPCFIYSICPTNDWKAWTSDGYSKTLTLLDMTGKVIQKVTHKAGIKDISLSPTSHRLWVCDEENNIIELVSGIFSKKIAQKFKTKDEPKCICVTSDYHIIIGMPKNISKYTTQGQIVVSTEVAGTATPLVCSPWRITECPITNSIAVIDHSNECDGGDGHQHVVVMDTDFRELFTYRGDIPSTYKQTPKTGDGPFDPWSIVYDRSGNIMAVDCNNDKIHILSGDGEVLRIIPGDKVWSVGVSRQDIIWSVNWEDKVKLLLFHGEI